jgi:glutamyl-tRNA reductase
MIFTVGISHKTAPVEVREQLAFTSAELPDALRHLRDELGGAIILSTCNRTELYITIPPEEVESVDGLVSLLPRSKGLSEAFDPLRFYVLHDQEAVRHLHRVAAGVDSMVLGEAQILGQVREALAQAQHARSAHPLLARLFRSAIASGRRARSETNIGRYSVSVSSTAVALAKRTLNKLSDRTVLIVSAGESGKLAAKSLLDSGASNIIVTNRTYAKARELATKLGGEAIPFNKLGEAVAAADIVISATESESFVLNYEDVQTVMAERKGRPLLLIDIAVPRDIDPCVRDVTSVHLYDIDDLQKVADTNMKQRAGEVHKVEGIIDEEIGRFNDWWRSLEVLPTIAALRQQAETSRRSELERTLKRLDLTPEEERRIEAMTSAIVKKILHKPIAHLKTNGNGHHYSDAVRALFELKDV